MSNKKVTFIALKEKREDGTIDSKAVERNMLMEAKRDGDEIMQAVLNDSLSLGDDPWSKALSLNPGRVNEFFNEISKDFDEHGIIDPNIKEPQYSDTSYVFTKPPKKESLTKRVFSWMKRKIKNTLR